MSATKSKIHAQDGVEVVNGDRITGRLRTRARTKASIRADVRAKFILFRVVMFFSNFYFCKNVRAAKTYCL